MLQMSIFEFIPDDLETFYQNGAMYAKVAEGSFTEESVKLGDKTLSPGQFVSKLGEKKRSSFEMQEGYLLRYAGKAGKLLLFGVNENTSDYYYAFGYVDPYTLVIGGKHGCKDIRLKTLEIIS